MRRARDIRTILERGERKRTPTVEVFFSASPVSRSRLGLVVGKLGHDVVERNVVKRRLREIGRRRVLPVVEACDQPTDVLLRARHRAYHVGFEELAADVMAAVEALCRERC